MDEKNTAIPLANKAKSIHQLLRVCAEIVAFFSITRTLLIKTISFVFIFTNILAKKYEGFVKK
jgi:hypothetical protein